MLDFHYVMKIGLIFSMTNQLKTCFIIDPNMTLTLYFQMTARFQMAVYFQQHRPCSLTGRSLGPVEDR